MPHFVSGVPQGSLIGPWLFLQPLHLDSVSPYTKTTPASPIKWSIVYVEPAASSLVPSSVFTTIMKLRAQRDIAPSYTSDLFNYSWASVLLWDPWGWWTGACERITKCNLQNSRFTLMEPTEQFHSLKKGVIVENGLLGAIWLGEEKK